MKQLSGTSKFQFNHYTHWGKPANEQAAQKMSLSTVRLYYGVVFGCL